MRQVAVRDTPGRPRSALRAAKPRNEIEEGAITVFLYQQFHWRHDRAAIALPAAHLQPAAGPVGELMVVPESGRVQVTIFSFCSPLDLMPGLSRCAMGVRGSS